MSLRVQVCECVCVCALAFFGFGTHSKQEINPLKPPCSERAAQGLPDAARLCNNSNAIRGSKKGELPALLFLFSLLLLLYFDLKLANCCRKTNKQTDSQADWETVRQTGTQTVGRQCAEKCSN